MNPRWKKVYRDLWNNRGRTLLVILAIAVGVFAFGSVFITRSILLQGMDSQFRKSNPSVINMSIDGFDQSLVNWLKSEPGVADARGKIVQTVKLVNPDKTEILNLNAISDYRINKIAVLEPKTGSWPPGKGEVVIERGSLSLVDARLGDELVLILPGDRHGSLRFSGTVFDISAVPARFFPQITAYVSPQTIRSLGLSDRYNQLNVVAESSYTDLDAINALADSLKNKLEGRGFRVIALETLRPDEHWGKAPTQAFVAILLSIGVATLIMTGFLVINTISSVIAQQKRQIGIMKAVGADINQLSVLYFLTVVIYGLFALVLSIPASLGLAYLFLIAISNFLNVDIVDFKLPFEVFLLMLFSSLLVPLISAAVPIYRGTSVTVREAISEFTEIKTRRSIIDNLLLSVKSSSRPVLLSLRNTFRDRKRLALTLSTLSLAGTLFMAVINLRGSFLLELDKAMARESFDLKILLGQSYSRSTLASKLKKIPSITFYDFEMSYPAQQLGDENEELSRFSLRGLEPSSPLFVPEILSGRWITQGDTASLVITKELQNNNPSLVLGKSLNLEIASKKSSWNIVGIANLTGFGNEFAFADIEYLTALADDPNKASTLNVRLTDHDSVSQLTASEIIENDFDRAGIKVANILTMSSLRESNIGMFNFLIAFLLSMAILVAVVGGLSLAGTMSLNVLERTREIGVMRSIGASNASLGRIILTEGLAIGILSWLIAIPLSFPVTYAFSYGVGIAFSGQPLPVNFSPAGILIWFAIVFVISAGGSLFPVRRAIAVSVREALAYE